MLTTLTPVVPRAWDRTNADAHFAPLYTELTSAEYTATLRRIFSSIRHATIPPYVQDVLYKTATNGHQVGSRKKKGEENCIRCDGKDRETLEHAYATCDPGAAPLWRLVVGRWNDATNDTLDASDLRLTLLGDRGEQRRALSEDLWRLVHAATAYTIHNAVRNANKTRDSPHHRQPQPQRMLADVRRLLQKLVTAAWDSRTTGALHLWSEWRTERWVEKRGGRAVVRILDGGYQQQGVDTAAVR